MSIRRAMPMVHSADLEASRAFYVGFLGFDIGMDEEGFTDEPWGIRRFFVRDPDGVVVNVASHSAG